MKHRLYLFGSTQPFCCFCFTYNCLRSNPFILSLDGIKFAVWLLFYFRSHLKSLLCFFCLFLILCFWWFDRAHRLVFYIKMALLFGVCFFLYSGHCQFNCYFHSRKKFETAKACLRLEIVVQNPELFLSKTDVSSEGPSSEWNVKVKSKLSEVFMCSFDKK